MSRRVPVTACLAAFAVGVLLLQLSPALPTPVARNAAIAACCVGALIAMLARRTSRTAAIRLASSIALVGLAACAGGLYAVVRADLRLADALPTQWEGRDIAIRGIVDDLPQVGDRGSRFAFEVEDVDTPGARVPHRLSLGWYAPQNADEPASDPPQVHPGERWHFTVRLKRPHGYVNPAGFDLEAWLLEHDLRASGVVQGAPAPERIEVFAGRLDDHVQRLRERIRGRILAALPEAPYAGVLVALAIGDRRAIPESQWQVFNRTGVSHLISISGLHVTAFATLAGGVAFLVLRRWCWLTTRVPARKVAIALGAALATFYVLLAGAEVPAVRTLAMLLAAAAGLWLGRPGSASCVWLWSLVAVLLLDPWAGFAPGFWLSFGAVGLLLYAGSGRLEDVPGPSWRARAWRTLREGARTQWAITVGLVPGTLALFQQVSLVSAIANAFAIPAVTLLIVPLALAGLVIPWDGIWHLAHALLTVLMRALEGLAALPSAAWASHAPLQWTLPLALFGIVLWLAPRGVPGRALALGFTLPMLLVTPARPPPGHARITALDVGQGLAVLVETHAHALLYDTGPRLSDTSDAGGRLVVPVLRALGVRTLDALVVSHQDLDHAGGALSILAVVPVRTLWSSLGVDHAIVRRAMTQGTAWRCAAGQQWTFDDVRFEILHPPLAQYAEEGVKTNDRSCVLRIEAQGDVALLTGDIEARSETVLLRTSPDKLHADVLVVPHHGSRTSSTPAFVTAVAPGIAIVTAGYRNRFNHPRADVVERYARRGSAVPRTDRDGAISLTLGAGAPIEAKAERDVRRRYWFDLPAIE
jgi:competence protein ComEC